jgi:hypothetical protein
MADASSDSRFLTCAVLAGAGTAAPRAQNGASRSIMVLLMVLLLVNAISRSRRYPKQERVRWLKGGAQEVV